MPTGIPSAGPTHRPTEYVPDPVEAEIDLTDISVHVLLIIIALVGACIFLAYLSVHLARKYHPEWFKRKKKKKKKKKNVEEKTPLSSKKLTSIAPDPKETADLAIQKMEAPPESPGLLG